MICPRVSASPRLRVRAGGRPRLRVRTDGSLHNGLHGTLVRAESEERGMAQASVGGPLGETHLRNVLWLDPGGALESRRFLDHRFRDRVSGQLAAKVHALFGIESGTDTSCIAQLSTVVDSQDERSDFAV